MPGKGSLLPGPGLTGPWPAEPSWRGRRSKGSKAPSFRWTRTSFASRSGDISRSWCVPFKATGGISSTFSPYCLTPWGFPLRGAQFSKLPLVALSKLRVRALKPNLPPASRVRSDHRKGKPSWGVILLFRNPGHCA